MRRLRSWKLSAGGRSRLLLDVFLQVFRSNLGSINYAFRVRRDALGCAGVARRWLLRVGNERVYRAILGAPDSHAAFPTRMIGVVRFGVSYIHDVFLVDENSARSAEL